MKLSILTATYNRAKLLKKLYESIVNNLTSNLEIEWLIMDDGSNDNTEQQVEGFINEKKLNIKYYKQENMGKMNAINNLINYSDGDLIIECDSDDFFMKNAFEKIYSKSNLLMENEKLYALVFLRNLNNKNVSGRAFRKREYRNNNV